MFSLPIGNNEKKGTKPDLEMKSSEIDYGVISYFLPKNNSEKFSSIFSTFLEINKVFLLFSSSFL